MIRSLLTTSFRAEVTVARELRGVDGMHEFDGFEQIGHLF